MAERRTRPCYRIARRSAVDVHPLEIVRMVSDLSTAAAPRYMNGFSSAVGP